MRPRRSFLLVVLLTAAAFPTAGAQIVNGQRVDSIAGVPVPGGFVVLLDTNNREVARALVRNDGRFGIPAPTAGVYRLKSERIGYRAFVSPSIELARGQTVDYLFRVMPIPVQLAAIEVRDKQRCGTRLSEDTATAVVWEEVRKALAATSWTARQRDYYIRILLYERDLDANRRRVRGEEIRSRSGRMVRNPFSSLPADRLAAQGFIVERGRDTWYYAPDAEVLQDDEFLDTHCFGLAEGKKDRKGLIGLAFEPTPNRTIPEVEGTLWLDLQSAELRLLEYRYTNTPYQIQDNRVGGTVEFHQLPSGMWIVREWQIRVPTIMSRGEVDALSGQRDVNRVVGFHDSGGEVFEISLPGGIPIFGAPVASVTGVATDSTTGGPLQGALLTLDGTDFVALTDSTGTFDLRAPLNGDYEITLTHPTIDSVGLLRLRQPVSLRRGRAQQVDFRVPHVESLLGRLCPDDGDGHRAVFGLVRQRKTGEPIARARVIAVWQDVTVPQESAVTEDPVEVRRPELPGGGHRRSVPVGAVQPPVEIDLRQSVAATDGTGFYTLCGLPVGTLIEFRSQTEELTSRVASVLFEDAGQPVALLGWDRRAGEAFGTEHAAQHRGLKLDFDLALSSDSAPVPPVALSGLVLDARTGQPLPAVFVGVNGVDTATTQRDGTFGFKHIEWHPGTNAVAFRRMGYSAALYEVRADTAVWMNVLLEPLAVELAEIVVAGERLMVPARMRGFYERRERGVGSFLTREEIERRMAPRLIDILLTVPGVRVRGAGDHLYLLRAGPRCRDVEPPIPPIVFVDGRTWASILADDPITELLYSIRPETVVGIEVYDNPTQVPFQFQRREALCGAIVIWTRSRS